MLHSVRARLSRRTPTHYAVVAQLAAILALGALPELAHAAAGDAITTILEKLVELLTSVWARSAAIIAVAILGYMAFVGRMSWFRAVQVILGIALVFGAATIVDLFTE
jgi:type IV secretion system protein VirB2